MGRTPAKPMSHTVRLLSACLLSAERYELCRRDINSTMVRVRASRRVRLGKHASVLFENRDTVLSQIHEQRWAESPSQPGRELAIISEHADLLVGPLELAFSVLLDTGSPSELEELAHSLARRPGAVRLSIAGRFCLKSVPLAPDTGGAVHYMKFRVPACLLWKPVWRLELDVPGFEASHPIPEALRVRLVADATGTALQVFPRNLSH